MAATLTPPAGPAGRYPIRIVAERPGLTPAAIRAWERRYSIVAPARSEGAQRLYSDADVERLRLVTQLSAAGYALAELARQSTLALARMAAAGGTGESLDGHAASGNDHSATIQKMIDHAISLDGGALRAELMQSVLELGPLPAMDQILSPFLARLGD